MVVVLCCELGHHSSTRFGYVFHKYSSAYCRCITSGIVQYDLFGCHDVDLLFEYDARGLGDYTLSIGLESNFLVHHKYSFDDASHHILDEDFDRYRERLGMGHVHGLADNFE